jgi:hypothetical protein
MAAAAQLAAERNAGMQVTEGADGGEQDSLRWPASLQFRRPRSNLCADYPLPSVAHPEWQEW